MNEQNTLKMKTDFPKLFRLFNSSQTQFQFWGAMCGDGWFDIVYQLCADIEIVAREAGCNARWWPRVYAIKEKFGCLRVQIERPRRLGEVINKLVEEAESASLKICEKCGAPGKRNEQGWYRTRCEEHTILTEES